MKGAVNMGSPLSHLSALQIKRRWDKLFFKFPHSIYLMEKSSRDVWGREINTLVSDYIFHLMLSVVYFWNTGNKNTYVCCLVKTQKLKSIFLLLNVAFCRGSLLVLFFIFCHFIICVLLLINPYVDDCNSKQRQHKANSNMRLPVSPLGLAREVVFFFFYEWKFLVIWCFPVFLFHVVVKKYFQNDQKALSCPVMYLSRIDYRKAGMNK